MACLRKISMDGHEDVSIRLNKAEDRLYLYANKLMDDIYHHTYQAKKEVKMIKTNPYEKQQPHQSEFKY